MVNFLDSSKTHTMLKKQISQSLKTSLENISYKVKLNFLTQFREDFKEKFGESSKITHDEFNAFINDKYEKQLSKLNRKKPKMKTLRKGPVKTSKYNDFVKLSIPKLKASFASLEQNDLMRYSGKIWQELKKQGKVDSVDDKFDFEKFVKDNKILE